MISSLVTRTSAALRATGGLVSRPLGWRTEWREGALHLRVRRAPLPSKSLHGLVVALDPGHPPDGTTGPSGLSEDSMTPAVALVAAYKLRKRGATVIHVLAGDRSPSRRAQWWPSSRVRTCSFPCISTPLAPVARPAQCMGRRHTK